MNEMKMVEELQKEWSKVMDVIDKFKEDEKNIKADLLHEIDELTKDNEIKIKIIQEQADRIDELVKMIDSLNEELHSKERTSEGLSYSKLVDELDKQDAELFEKFEVHEEGKMFTDEENEALIKAYREQGIE